MKYHDLSPKLRSMVNLLAVGILGAVIAVMLKQTLFPSAGHSPNRFLDPLIPILFGGTALTLFTTFTYGVITLATESDAKNRRSVIGVMVITLVVAYLFLYNVMGPGGLG